MISTNLQYKDSKMCRKMRLAKDRLHMFNTAPPTQPEVTQDKEAAASLEWDTTHKHTLVFWCSSTTLGTFLQTYL